MPLTRYRIRNEYGLADPELYRAADKDDPEALLEGVAMAGLVGVLRQLGDLAEFAAEIFHDLHEEVMATAARGHGLMARVQQLEAEFPSVEKAFLTQTDPTPFFTNAGVDWHPNLRMEQNLITRGDLPRFVMESYEECRGPPRLFLLDKFDVAGAGACLKRYTDPSVFNVEAVSFGAPTVEAQREKKNRRTKKKGARLRNGETPEVVPSAHSKLHQLFLEEHVENDFSDPARLVKLKRRHLHGFPFDPKPGKSYMEKFLATPSPERKEVHEVSVHQSPLRVPLDSSDDPELQVIEIGTVSPAKRSSQGQEDTSPVVEEAELKPIAPELNEEPFSKEIVKVPDLTCGSEADKSPYFIDERALENGLAVDEDKETEGSLGGDGSDEFLSEVDNYMDALTTVESEMETDNDYKPKTGMGFLAVGKHLANSDAIGEHLDVRANFSDSQSFGNLSVSDNGKSISWKGRSSLSCSDSVSNSAEHTPSDDERAPRMITPEDGVSDALRSPMDRPSVHSVDQGNESTELTYFGEKTTCETGKALPSVPTVNSTIQGELDEIPSDYSEPGSKSPDTDHKGSHLPDSVLSDAPLQTLHGDNSVVEDLRVEELVHKEPDVFVNEAGVYDLEEEVDDGSVDKISAEGEIGSPQSVTSLVSVNEKHQTDHADRVCDKDRIEGEVGPTHRVNSSSEEQLLSSDPSLTIQTNSEVSDGITGQTIDSENLTERATTPELDSIEGHDSVGGLRVTDPEENAKRLEEIYTATDNEQMNVQTGKLDVEGEHSVLFEQPDSEKSGSGPVNSDEPVDASLVTVSDANDASCLPSDLVGSNSSDFVDILEYLGGNEPPQNGTDNNGVLPECPVEPEELKMERQLAVASTELISSSFEASLNLLESKTPESLLKKTPENASDMGQERGLDVSSKQESLSPALLMPSTIHELHDTAISRNPFDSALPSFDQLPEISEEMPPLPPLPPMQWRMGKFQPPSPALQGLWTDHGKGSYLSMQPFTADEKSQFDFSSVARIAADPPNPFLSNTSDISNSQQLSLDSPDYTIQKIPLSTGMATPVTDQSSRQDCLQLDGTKSSNPYFSILMEPHEKSSTAATVATEATEFDLVSSHSSQTEPLNQAILEPTSEAKTSGKYLQLEVDEQNQVEKSGLPSTASEDQALVILEPTSEAKGSERSLQNLDAGEQNYVGKSGYPPTTSEDQAQVILEPTSKAKESEKSLQNSHVDEQNYVEKSGSLPTTSEEQGQHDLVNLQGQTTWPSTLVLHPTYEAGKPNGSKIPRPRNPLIDAVAAHDKSKLRKVTERVQPQVGPKEDERDSLLEQIRTKSFNLKPAAVSRPSVQGIQGPKTNLKVAAILEKANAIRQALTGSDEDEDSDSWSDS